MTDAASRSASDLELEPEAPTTPQPELGPTPDSQPNHQGNSTGGNGSARRRQLLKIRHALGSLGAPAVWGFLTAFLVFYFVLRVVPILTEVGMTGWLLFSLGVTGGLGIVLLWKVPHWQVGHVAGLEPKERFDRINEARKTLAQIIAGILLLSGFYSTVQNLTLTQKSLSIAQDGQITDRFTKAIEELGAVDSNGKRRLEVRLGGIYALERIANDSERDRQPIVQVLAAYVRENAPIKAREGQQVAKGVEAMRPTEDIQAVLTVLGRRKTNEPTLIEVPRPPLGENEIFFVPGHIDDLDLAQSDIRGANLWAANLENADLNGANLTGVNLSFANLRQASFVGTDLNRANLENANCDGVNLSKANLMDAKLNSAYFGNADLLEVTHLTQEQIETAKGNAATRLPAGLHMPASWKNHP